MLPQIKTVMDVKVELSYHTSKIFISGLGDDVICLSVSDANKLSLLIKEKVNHYDDIESMCDEHDLRADVDMAKGRG